MNEKTNIIAPQTTASGTQAAEGVAKFCGYEEAFGNLEPLIDRLHGHVDLLSWLVSRALEAEGDVTISETRAKHLRFIAYEAYDAAGALDRTWLAYNNAACVAERAKAGR